VRGASTYSICPSCCGVIPRHQCGPSPPPLPQHVVGCTRHCSAASPGLARPSPPPLHMQHVPTTSPGVAAFQQPAPPHVHDCPSCRLTADDRPPLSVEPGYLAGSWPDPVTAQCPVHGRYQPFVAGFHQTVCSTDHLHLTHPHQFVCHHQQPSHLYQASYAVQAPQPSLISQPHYALPASGVVNVSSVATLGGDWYHQHQPDCQLMSLPMTTPLMHQQQLQQRDAAGIGLTNTDTDVGYHRLEPSLQSADDVNTSMTHQGKITPAAAETTTSTAGDV